MTSCIYKIENLLNNKIYIGKTNDPIRRWKSHKSDYKKYNNRYLYRAMNKYGLKNFIFEVICSDIDDAEIDDYEIKYIKLFNSKAPNGYNMTDGGEGSIGRPMKESTKIKLNKARLDKGVSDETKLKQSIAHKKRYSDPKERLKTSEVTKGHKKSSLVNYKKYWENLTSDELSNRTYHLRDYKIVPVLMLDLNTLEILMEFDSLRGASAWLRENTVYHKAGHGNISKACKGKINYVYGYKWKYKDE